MPDPIIPLQTPEEQEFDEKRRLLAELEETLAHRELDLVTLKAEIQAFEQYYLQVLGSRFMELDDILSRVARQKHEMRPEDDEARAAYEQAWQQAQESARTYEEVSDAAPAPVFEASEELRALFRKVAKAVHPDLAVDEEDRKIRHDLMVRANRAYQEGDEKSLRAILEEYAGRPGAVVEDGVGGKLVKVIRMIAQVRRRIEEIEAQIAELLTSGPGQLWQQAKDLGLSREEAVQRLAERIDDQIARALEEWAELVRQRSKQ